MLYICVQINVKTIYVWNDFNTTHSNRNITLKKTNFPRKYSNIYEEIITQAHTHQI